MWSCGTCTLENPARLRRCGVCGDRKPIADDGTAAAAAAAIPVVVVVAATATKRKRRGAAVTDRPSSSAVEDNEPSGGLPQHNPSVHHFAAAPAAAAAVAAPAAAAAVAPGRKKRRSSSSSSSVAGWILNNRKKRKKQQQPLTAVMNGRTVTVRLLPLSAAAEMVAVEDTANMQRAAAPEQTIAAAATAATAATADPAATRQDSTSTPPLLQAVLGGRMVAVRLLSADSDGTAASKSSTADTAAPRSSHADAADFSSVHDSQQETNAAPARTIPIKSAAAPEGHCLDLNKRASATGDQQEPACSPPDDPPTSRKIGTIRCRRSNRGDVLAASEAPNQEAAAAGMQQHDSVTATTPEPPAVPDHHPHGDCAAAAAAAAADDVVVVVRAQNGDAVLAAPAISCWKDNDVIPLEATTLQTSRGSIAVGNNDNELPSPLNQKQQQQQQQRMIPPNVSRNNNINTDSQFCFLHEQSGGQSLPIPLRANDDDKEQLPNGTSASPPRNAKSARLAQQQNVDERESHAEGNGSELSLLPCCSSPGIAETAQNNELDAENSCCTAGQRLLCLREEKHDETPHTKAPQDSSLSLANSSIASTEARIDLNLLEATPAVGDGNDSTCAAVASEMQQPNDQILLQTPRLLMQAARKAQSAAAATTTADDDNDPQEILSQEEERGCGFFYTPATSQSQESQSQQDYDHTHNSPVLQQQHDLPNHNTSLLQKLENSVLQAPVDNTAPAGFVDSETAQQQLSGTNSTCQTRGLVEGSFSLNEQKECAPVTAFQTAGRGSIISVSAESLAKADALLAHKDAKQPDTVISATSNPVARFQTAGIGKTIAVSSERMRRAESMMGKDQGGMLHVAAAKVTSIETPELHSEVALKPADVSANLTEWTADSCAGFAALAAHHESGNQEQEATTSHETLAIQKTCVAHGAIAGANAESCLTDGEVASRPLHAAVFCTAGRGSNISISADSFAQANTLLSESGNASRGATDTTKKTISPSSLPVVQFRTAMRGCAASVSDGISKSHRDHAPLESQLESAVKPAVEFHTAGFGTKVSVSTESISKAASVLAERRVVKHGEDIAPRERLNSFIGFQTAGLGSKVSVSTASIAKACAILGDDSQTACRDTVRGDATRKASSRLPRIGFQTAGPSNSMSVSAESTTRAAAILGIDKDPFIRDESNRNRPSVGFQTAGLGAKVIVSAESSARASSVLSGEGDGLCDAPANSSVPPLVGFQTAGLGAKVTVSAESIARATSVLNGEGDGLYGRPDAPAMNSLVPPSLVFQTAGLGAKVAVSTESIARASSFLKDEGDGLYEPRDVPVTKSSVPPSVGFRTARLDAKVAVCTESIARASSVLKDEGNALYEPRDVPATKSSVPPSVGFQTAGLGAKVTVSAESIARASSFLKDEGDGSYGRRDAFVASSSVPSSFGFQTAGLGAKVNVSAESIARASVILKDGMGAHQREDAPSSLHMPIEFQTTGLGNAVSVSEDSIARPTAVSTEGQVPQPREKPVKSCSTAPSAGLQSGGLGPKVAVMDESISRASSIMNAESVKHQDNEYFFARPSIGIQTAELGNTLSVSDERSTTVSTLPNGESAAVPQCPKDPDTVNASKRVSVSPRSLLREEVCDRVQAGSAKDSPFQQQQATPRVSFDAVEGSRRLNDPSTLGHIVDEKTPSYGHFPNNFPLETSTNQKLITPFADSSTNKHHLENMGSSDCVSVDQPNERYAGCDPESEKLLSLATIDTPARTLDGLETDDQVSVRKVDDVVLSISSTNAGSVRFDTVTLLPVSFYESDDASEQNMLGFIDDFRRELVAHGCDDKLIKDKWVTIHIRWIVWKMASIERSFAESLGGPYLTFQRVVEQLIHRYNKELRKGSRPAVQKLLTRDVSAHCMMILCVARIKRHEPPVQDQERASLAPQDTFLVEVTDGWYSLPAVPDARLCEFIENGRIRIGTKLLLSNSSLVGFDEGIDPLDPSYDPFKAESAPVLKIAANSTRLARWDAKLGFVRPSTKLSSQNGMLLVRRIGDVLEGGGRVPLIDLRVVRRHPTLYLERRSGGEGKARILTEREENTRIEEREKRRQNLVELFSEEIQAECIKEVDEDAPDSWRRVMAEGSSSNEFDDNNENTRSEIERWQARRTAKLQVRMTQEIDAKLEEHDLDLEPSLPFVKLVVRNYVSTSEDEAMLTIWKPSDDQLDLLQEGAVLRVMNLDVKSGRRFDGRIQFSGSNNTPISILPHTAPEMNLTMTYTSIFRLQLLSKRMWEDTETGQRSLEINIIGVVSKAKKNVDGPGWSTYLTDESNLRIRVYSDSNRVDLDDALSTISCNPNQAESVVAFRDLLMMPYDFSESCAVAHFRESSEVLQNPACKRCESLRRWSESETGLSQIQKQLRYVEAGVAEIDCDPESLKAVGYIAGFHIRSSHQLLVRVDCGREFLESWVFPLPLLSSFAGSCGDLDKVIVMNDEEEAKMTRLTTIGHAFRARQKLYCFSLRSVLDTPLADPDCRFKVSKVASVDASALAALYSALLH